MPGFLFLGPQSSVLGPVAVSSALILGLCASGLGLGYAFWAGAAALAFLTGMGLEETVNHLSADPLCPGAMGVLFIVLAGSMMGVLCGRMRLVERWMAFAATFPNLLAETVAFLPPRAGPGTHGATEPARPRGPVPYGTWIYPAVDLVVPWGPTFAVSCWLLKLDVARASWLFAGLGLALLAAAFWDRQARNDEAPPENRSDASPEIWFWGALPFAALPFGWPGLVAGIALAIGAAWIRLRAGWAGDLEPLLADGLPSTRLWAVRAVARSATPRSARLLLTLLADADPAVRAAAAQGLGICGSRRDAARIRELLSDPDGQVRTAAVMTLARLAGRRGLASIRELLSDPDAGVRESAQYAARFLRERRREPRDFLWEGFSMDLAVLVVGILSFAAVVDGAGLPGRLAEGMVDGGLEGSKALLVVFSAALAGSLVAARTLAGLGVCYPLFRAVAGPGEPSAALVIAAVGGAVLGAALRPFAVRDAVPWERPSLARSIPAALAVAAICLLPGFLQEWMKQK